MSTPTVFTGPPYDDSALVFSLRRSPDALASVRALNVETPGRGGLGLVDAYRRTHPGARLVALGARIDDPSANGGFHGFIQPELIDPQLEEMGLAHILHLESPADSEELMGHLKADPNVAFVAHPAIQYPLIAPPAVRAMATPNEDQWALVKCGFPDVWQDLEQGDDPGRVAVVDDGLFGHQDLHGRICIVLRPRDGTLRGGHGTRVAGVLGAKRGGEMSGCCSAKMDFFGVWSSKGFDAELYYRSLIEIAKRKYPVLNLSMGSRAPDEMQLGAIRDCVRAGVVVVAAAGDGLPASEVIYPAAFGDDVIAVSGTDQFDSPFKGSVRGPHIFIGAPAQQILTLARDDDFLVDDGTSYAAPMVSAAVWLAKHRKPSLTVSEVRCLLAKSAHPTSAGPARNQTTGFGRLDVRRLAALLA